MEKRIKQKWTRTGSEGSGVNISNNINKTMEKRINKLIAVFNGGLTKWEVERIIILKKVIVKEKLNVDQVDILFFYFIHCNIPLKKSLSEATFYSSEKDIKELRNTILEEF